MMKRNSRHRLFSASFLCQIILAVFLFFTAGIPVQAKEVDVYFPDQDEHYLIDWDWELFFGDSHVLNHDLAMDSLLLCAKAYGDLENQTDLYSDMGFDHFELVGFSDSDINLCPLAIAMKSYEHDGEQYALILLNIRGTVNTSDYLTDIVGGLFEGFYSTGSFLYDRVTDYILKYVLPDYDESHMRFLITGHSLGGAASVQLLRFLYFNDCCTSDNTYVYTFSSPKYDVGPDPYGDYSNVFNYYIRDDFIPTVPIGPNVRRLGTDVVLKQDEYMMLNWPEAAELLLRPLKIDTLGVNAFEKHMTWNYLHVMERLGYTEETDCFFGFQPKDLILYTLNKALFFVLGGG